MKMTRPAAALNFLVPLLFISAIAIQQQVSSAKQLTETDPPTVIENECRRVISPPEFVDYCINAIPPYLVLGYTGPIDHKYIAGLAITSTIDALDLLKDDTISTLANPDARKPEVRTGLEALFKARTNLVEARDALAGDMTKAINKTDAAHREIINAKSQLPESNKSVTSIITMLNISQQFMYKASNVPIPDTVTKLEL